MGPEGIHWTIEVRSIQAGGYSKERPRIRRRQVGECRAASGLVGGGSHY